MTKDNLVLVGWSRQRNTLVACGQALLECGLTKFARHAPGNHGSKGALDDPTYEVLSVFRAGRLLRNSARAGCQAHDNKSNCAEARRVHGAMLFVQPNVEANLGRGGRRCKAGLRPCYYWRSPALQRLP